MVSYQQAASMRYYMRRCPAAGLATVKFKLCASPGCRVRRSATRIAHLLLLAAEIDRRRRARASMNQRFIYAPTHGARLRLTERARATTPSCPSARTVDKQVDPTRSVNRHLPPPPRTSTPFPTITVASLIYASVVRVRV